MNEQIRRINEIAELSRRVQCENGHWTAARTMITDLVTRERVLVYGQTCRCGAKIS